MCAQLGEWRDRCGAAKEAASDAKHEAESLRAQLAVARQEASVAEEDARTAADSCTSLVCATPLWLLPPARAHTQVCVRVTVLRAAVS